MHKARGNVVLVGTFTAWGGPLEESYERAFHQLGWVPHRFDFPSIRDHTNRFGVLGRRLFAHFQWEQWLRKIGRELILLVRRIQPELVIVFGQTQIHPGSLAQLRASTNARLVLLWPDTLQNLSAITLDALPLYDVVGCYSNSACPIFERLGAPAVVWVPFAGDPELHPDLLASQVDLAAYQCDISFVGNWRPEREAALSVLSTLKGVRIRVWGGNSWRKARDPSLVGRMWEGRGAFGEEFVLIARASKICLNVIDDINFPAANMRFFEIPCAGGVELCSPCPEMRAEFPPAGGVFFYDSLRGLSRMAEALLQDSEKLKGAGQLAKDIVRKKHTYTVRVVQLLTALRLGCDQSGELQR